MASCSNVCEKESQVLLASTAPGPNGHLHKSSVSGESVRALGAVTVGGVDILSNKGALCKASICISDIRSVPAAVPPLPHAGGVRGGTPSYAAQQGNDDFFFDYAFAFRLKLGSAFTKDGFGVPCPGSVCKSNVSLYTRGAEPFIWERKRNRGDAIICPGGGGHLLCLRCLDAMYGEGRPFVSTVTGEAIGRSDLSRKYEAFLDPGELRETQLGQPTIEGGRQFFVQRRDLEACSCCRKERVARRGVKKALVSGPTRKELGPAALNIGGVEAVHGPADHY